MGNITKGQYYQRASVPRGIGTKAQVVPKIIDTKVQILPKGNITKGH